uniref:RNA-directed DNA polymerase, eukaryota, reverse transcriptase zinc-binding domain protein n=1 Tax=Tanacetum cinerariifolium TaxID=118510 RepID=A0A699GSV5_TANCI|nr:RNA-directed DNA polymerase, eukaryota, reverse transcriptase zinc-binding domain protein [Tanacetum cinerariifolium]
MSLYKRSKYDYDDNLYDDDEELEDLTEEQLALSFVILFFVVKLDVSYQFWVEYFLVVSCVSLFNGGSCVFLTVSFSTGLISGSYDLNIKKGFLSPKGRGRGNDVKKKHDCLTDDPPKNKNNVIIDTTSSLNVDKSLDQNSDSILGLNSLDGAIDKQNEKLTDYGAYGGKQTSEVLSITAKIPIVNSSGSISYAKLLNGEPSWKTINFHTLLAPVGNGADIAISMELVRVVHEWLSNTVYGFLWGTRVAYPVVKNYVKNTWSTYGLNKSMMTIKDMFFFNFSSKDGLDAMIEFLGRSSHARAMVKLQVDELKDTLSMGRIQSWLRRGNLDVVSSANGNSSKAFGSPNTTPLTARINNLERHVMNKKLMLVDDDDDGKPLMIMKWTSKKKEVVNYGVNSGPDTSNVMMDNVGNTFGNESVNLDSSPTELFMLSTSGHLLDLQVVSLSTRIKKKQVGLSRQEVSNSNPFDALNLVENDDDLGTNGVNSKLAEKGADSCVWKPPRCSACKVFGHVLDDCLEQIVSDVLKNLKNPRKVVRGVQVISLVNSDSESEVEEMFNGTTCFMSSTSLKSVSEIWYGTKSLLEQWRETKVDDEYDPYDYNLYDSHDMYENLQAFCDDWDIKFASNTPIGEKIDKIERQICDGKLSEVKVVFDETANLRISMSGKDGSDKGYGTNSLLEQWRNSYPNNDDYDPYDEDMYENHDLFEHPQSICDDLDITVRGRKKK